MNYPQLIFGGASIGARFVDLHDMAALENALQTSSITRVDTAARYPVNSPGQSQRLLGEARFTEKGFSIDTKINYFGDGSGTLAAEAIDASLQESLLSLNVSKVNVLYCHAPDNTTPLEEQAAALNNQYKKGLFKELGVSNFPTEMVEEYIQICEEKGYVKPTWYQGQYSIVCRTAESALLPALRKHGIKFTAYSPLAGGFLTGKLSAGTNLEGTRFAEGSIYRKWYDKPSMYEFIERLGVAVKSYEISMEEASLRWVVHHSALSGNDGVIIGASTISQLDNSTRQIGRGPLPEALVKVLDDMWNIVKDDAPQVLN